MAKCEIYFSIFSEIIHTILKIFSQRDLGSVSRGYCKKKKYNFIILLEFLVKFFG